MSFSNIKIILNNNVLIKLLILFRFTIESWGGTLNRLEAKESYDVPLRGQTSRREGMRQNDYKPKQVAALMQVKEVRSVWTVVLRDPSQASHRTHSAGHGSEDTSKFVVVCPKAAQLQLCHEATKPQGIKNTLGPSTVTPARKYKGPRCTRRLGNRNQSQWLLTGLEVGNLLSMVCSPMAGGASYLVPAYG